MSTANPVEASPTVSVVIVNYNAGLLLRECVGAVLQSSIALEVFISDSGSSDDSLSAVEAAYGGDPRLAIIRNGENIGFARANNVALRQARGRFVLLLNPDCLIERDTLRRMLEVMASNPEAGMAGCLLRNPDGSEQAGCRRAVPTPWRTFVRTFRLHRIFPNHPRFRDFVLTNEPLPAEPTPVEAISGAFMLVRRKALESVGLFDEGYFLHCEDLDWCKRFWQAGWQVVFVPDVEAIHHKGACSQRNQVRVLWHKHRGMVRYYRKFFRHEYPSPLMWTVYGAVWVRFASHAVVCTVTEQWVRGKKWCMVYFLNGRKEIEIQGGSANAIRHDEREKRIALGHKELLGDGAEQYSLVKAQQSVVTAVSRSRSA